MNTKGGSPDERPERSSLQAGERPADDARGRSFLAWPFSIAAHAALFAAVVWLWSHGESPPDEPALIVAEVVELPAPPGPSGASDDEAGGSPTAAETAPPEPAVPDVPVPEVTEPVAAAVTPTPDTVLPTPKPVPKPMREEAAEAPAVPDTSDILSESQLAGAARADGAGSGDGIGGGGGGGGCDTVRHLQRALQRDTLVHKAVATANRSGKAVMLWNGDWVRSGEQHGKGLSGVREAIMWELAFAPEACRNKRVSGLVLLSLADGTRFAIGADDWRWSDLLGVRTGGRPIGATPERR